VLVENEVVQRAGRRADRGGVLTDAHDGPAGVAVMAEGHVLRDGGVLVIAAHALMPAIRSPWWKISTARAVNRTSTSANF
jgi:hypothetical protein